ncbi:MAG: N-6 DNA methylase [Betaproteobacteria bacterium]|nr:N-6 DNA methylase [Betaproteobacteria bacterium]
MNLIKSKQRVADHGEVFTPDWLVEAMLDLVKDESERIDSRFLEPACGSGNFLIQILKRKLASVEIRYGKSEFDRNHYALLGLMCIYGIELLKDNIKECRANLLEIFDEYLGINEDSDIHKAASFVLSQNIVHGDALSMKTTDGNGLVFPEWVYNNDGFFVRQDYRFNDLIGASANSAKDSLFSILETHETFFPIKTYPHVTIKTLISMKNGYINEG